MLAKRQIVSLSFSPKTLFLLDRICQKEEKNRSQMVRSLVKQYATERKWQEIFALGKKTAKKFKIRSESDVLKILND